MFLKVWKIITPHAQRERDKVIGCGVHIYIYVYMFVDEKIFESYFRDRLTFSNIRSRTSSHRIYRLALPLRAPETLSSLSKSRISIFNAHLTLFVRRMTSHTSIGKSKLTWNRASPFADQTSRMQNWKEVNV